MKMPSVDNLRTIRVVEYMNGAFVGLPYQLRPGQRARDILSRFNDDWVWLGSPGWYGPMTADQVALARKYYELNLADVAWYEGCSVDIRTPCEPE